MPAVFSPDVLISERFTESGFDDFRRAVVTVFEKVTVDTEGDGGGGMAKPPADGNPYQRQSVGSHGCGGERAGLLPAA